MKAKERISKKFLPTNCKNEKVGKSQSVNLQFERAKKYFIRQSGQFKRSEKLSIKRGYSENDLAKVIELLAGGGQLPAEFLNPTLTPLVKSLENFEVF